MAKLSLPCVCLCLVVSLGWMGLALAASCDLADGDKVDCGQMGTNQGECEGNGCCWVPVKSKDTPWCFYPSDVTHPPNGCDSLNWAGTGPGFTDDFYNKMYEFYKANLNVEGCGAVVAAPDGETPGGSYYYHWMRDAGLSIKAWMDINDNDYNACKDAVGSYAGWVSKVQQKNDPNGIDVRIEPKFTIPDGEPYTGGWCRPQTDGPALRAMALSKWGIILHNSGNGNPSEIWSLVKFDMDWVVENWQQDGCDLWEEVRSNNFFWNRMSYIYSLNAAADFAELIGQDGGNLRSTANTIKDATKEHWNGEFLWESQNRQQDGASIHAITTFGEFLYPPSSSEAASTIRVLTKTFCNEYPINQQENGQGNPGILIGRYPGDSYAGGNPWQLLTAVLAECFYMGASATYKSMEAGGDYTLDFLEQEEWIKLVNLEEGATAKELARAQVAAGDAVMARLWDHVKGDGGRIDEQIDKHSGAQSSAAGLTWSYANILHALHTRNMLKTLDH